MGHRVLHLIGYCIAVLLVGPARAAYVVAQTSRRSRGKALPCLAALLLLGALATPTGAATILPTLDGSGTYDYDANPPGPGSLGIISFNTINVSQVQYQDLSTCNVVGPLCDDVVGVQPTSFVSITLTDFSQQTEGLSVFSTATITITDGTTTFISGAVSLDTWIVSAAQLTLNATFDLDNLTILSTDNGGSSQFIDEFAAAVAAGAGGGDLPELHIILNNFNGLNSDTNNQFVNIKISSPIVLTSPEPNTMVLLGLGLIGIGVHAKRKKRKAAE